MKVYVGVTGGRTYNKYRTITRIVTQLRDDYGGKLVVVHGCAPGADSLASKACKVLGVAQRRFPANWEEHGTAAGPIRNRDMAAFLRGRLDRGHEVMLISFPGGTGTADMIAVSKKLEIEVIDHEDFIKHMEVSR